MSSWRWQPRRTTLRNARANGGRDRWPQLMEEANRPFPQKFADFPGPQVQDDVHVPQVQETKCASGPHRGEACEVPCHRPPRRSSRRISFCLMSIAKHVSWSGLRRSFNHRSWRKWRTRCSPRLRTETTTTSWSKSQVSLCRTPPRKPRERFSLCLNNTTLLVLCNRLWIHQVPETSTS